MLTGSTMIRKLPSRAPEGKCLQIKPANPIVAPPLSTPIPWRA
jgi:hypothetical protein